MPRFSSLFRLATAFFGLLAFANAASAQTAEVYFRNTTTNMEERLDASTPQIRHRLPVFFVHGHNTEDALDADFNYQKNWQNSQGSLPSFRQVLDLPDNSELGIEAYYIRFVQQDRSITEDAAEIRDAVDLILHRHDPEFAYPYDAAHPTHVKIVIIAYSKGTLGTRKYLKTLLTDRPGFNPVSEFIAISPPNHGISTALFAATDSIAVKQLYNGMRPEVSSVAAAILGISPSHCTDSFNEAGATNYIGDLNGHPIADSISLTANEFYADEAPGSRPDLDPMTGAPNPPTRGTLFVTIFSNGNDDFVGGLTPSTDCPQPDGRRLARNLSEHAINLEVDVDGSLPLTVHRNTVHTPEVICLALFAAVHHRSPDGQACAPGAGNLPIIPAPTRAAAVLSLDFSGSMSALTCPTCPSRDFVLKEAVELFVQLWSAVSVPTDRLGVNYFSTNVTPFLPTLTDPPPLLSDSRQLILDDLGNHSPGGNTAMGGGLQRAIEALNRAPAETQIRRAIIFTDGMQNMNPMVRTVNSQLVINNQMGRPNSNVPVASPTPFVLDTSLGIAVDTIGIGIDPAFVGLLQEISADTGGRSWPTADPLNDLRRYFVEELINGLKGFSPQLVADRRGAIASRGSNEVFAIEDGVRKLVLKVSWKSGDSLDFSVAKDGVDVTSAGHFINGAFYKIFVIDLPAKDRIPISARGNWQLLIKGKRGAAYEAAAIVDGGQITYDAMFDAKRPRVGDAFDLIAQVTANRQPIDRGAKVSVALMSPAALVTDIIGKSRSKSLPIFEPAMTIADRRLLAVTKDEKKWAALKPNKRTVVLRPNEKGEFRLRLRPRMPGIYTAVVTIEGDDPKLGQFSRTITAITVVRAAK